MTLKTVQLATKSDSNKWRDKDSNSGERGLGRRGGGDRVHVRTVTIE